MTPPPLAPPAGHPTAVCGPSCRYRALYEGAQLTLSSMGERQAEALSRVGRLRAEIVRALRHLDPAGFVDAERKAGRRLSDIDDDVLAGYLHAFLSGALASGTGQGMHELRDALAAAGFALPPGTDPSAWAAAIRSRQAYSQATAPTGSTPTGSAPTPAVAPPVVIPHTPAPTLAPAPGVDDLADLFAAADEVRAQQSGSPLGGVDDLEALFAGDDPAVHGVDALEDLFADDPVLAEPVPAPEPDAPVWEDAPADTPAWDEPLPPTDDLIESFPGEPALDEPVPSEPTPPVLPAPAIIEAPAEPTPAPVEDKPATKAANKPLRPQMMPLPGQQAAPLGRRRTGKSTSPLHVDAATAPTVADEVNDALLAAVSAPRPVFIDDLRAVVPAEQALAAWETRMRADARAPIRFIPAKARYRHLGSLVVPRDEIREVQTEFSHSLWNDCINAYRGAKLYEMGVLLRLYASSVVGSWSCTDDTAMFRMTDGRGMTGVVTFLGPDPRVDGVREQVLECVEQLMKERLTLLVILATNTEAVPAMRDLILEQAPLRQWAPLMPVALSRASDFASNRSGAELLLGG